MLALFGWSSERTATASRSSPLASSPTATSPGTALSSRRSPSAAGTVPADGHLPSTGAVAERATGGPDPGPMSLASVASAPFAGRMADRYGRQGCPHHRTHPVGRRPGLVLWATRLYDSRGQFITGLIIAGFGLGMTFAPLQSIAMHNIQPRIAGAAAGLINTTRQLGAVLGSAAVGALLQAQIAAHLRVSARDNVNALPQSFRPRFLEGFEKAAQAKGLEVGSARPVHTCRPRYRRRATRHRAGRGEDVRRGLHPGQADDPDPSPCRPRPRRHGRAPRAARADALGRRRRGDRAEPSG